MQVDDKMNREMTITISYYGNDSAITDVSVPRSQAKLSLILVSYRFIPGLGLGST